jgi:hypothetical protein
MSNDPPAWTCHNQPNIFQPPFSGVEKLYRRNIVGGTGVWGFYGKVKGDFLADLVDPGVETSALVRVNFVRQRSGLHAIPSKQDNGGNERRERSNNRTSCERHPQTQSTNWPGATCRRKRSKFRSGRGAKFWGRFGGRTIHATTTAGNQRRRARTRARTSDQFVVRARVWCGRCHERDHVLHGRDRRRGLGRTGTTPLSNNFRSPRDGGRLHRGDMLTRGIGQVNAQQSPYNHEQKKNLMPPEPHENRPL